jgi:hypothetical protein
MRQRTDGRRRRRRLRSDAQRVRSGAWLPRRRQQSGAQPLHARRKRTGSGRPSGGSRLQLGQHVRQVCVPRRHVQPRQLGVQGLLPSGGRRRHSCRSWRRRLRCCGATWRSWVTLHRVLGTTYHPSMLQRRVLVPRLRRCLWGRCTAAGCGGARVGPIPMSSGRRASSCREALRPQLCPRLRLRPRRRAPEGSQDHHQGLRQHTVAGLDEDQLLQVVFNDEGEA